MATHYDDRESELVEHIRNLESKLTQLQSTIDEKNNELERLKGLIETLHSEAFGINPVKWWDYKNQNNL